MGEVLQTTQTRKEEGRLGELHWRCDWSTGLYSSLSGSDLRPPELELDTVTEVKDLLLLLLYSWPPSPVRLGSR